MAVTLAARYHDRMKHEQVRLLLCIGDSHCGSTVGLAHPTECVLPNDGRYRPNKLQEWLWGCHLDLINRWLPEIAGDEPFGVVHMGDAIEGYHHRTKETWTTDDAAMRGCFIACYRDIAERAAFWLQVRGTECHTGEDNEAACGFALGATPHPESNRHASDKWQFEFNGLLVDAQHHMSTTGRPYLETGAGGRDAATAALYAMRAGHRAPDIMLRGHAHTFAITQDATCSTVRIPAWQGLTRFGKKVVGNAVCLPGAVLLDARHCKPGETPHIRWILYRPEQGPILGSRE